MRRVIPGRDADAEAVVARLRSALRPGAQVVIEGDAKIVVRRGPLRRCKVTLLQASDGAAVEVRGDSGGVPVPLAAAMLRWIGERTVGTEVAAALQDRHGDPGGPPQP
jgi:hypothetical protein